MSWKVEIKEDHLTIFTVHVVFTHQVPGSHTLGKAMKGLQNGQLRVPSRRGLPGMAEININNVIQVYTLIP